MECHRCPHWSAIQAGKYRDVPFEQTPCSRCAFRERSIFSVEFRDGQGGGGSSASPFVRLGSVDLDRIATVDVPFPEEYEEPEPSLPLTVMGEAIAQLMRMAPVTRDVICLRFNGLKYAEIARRLGVTVAAAELCHRRALARWPPLRALFVAKMAKQRRRKKHRRPGGETSTAEQGVLGASGEGSTGV